MKNQNGQAAILIIFVLGMISVFIGISLVQTGFGESLMGRANPSSAKAFYNANSGVEEALYRLNNDICNPLTPGCPSDTFDLTNAGWQTTVTVSIEDPINHPNQRTIESAAKSGLYIRKIKTKVIKTTTTSPFKYAIQADDGGIEFTKKVKTPFIVGDIYSNGDIAGDSCTDIVGSVWAANGGMSNVAITGNAQGQPINECFIGGTKTETPAPEADMPEFDLTVWQNYLAEFPPITPPTGTYTALGTIGNMTINGNLKIDSDVVFTGPVWVTGSIKIKAEIALDPNIVSIGRSQVLIAEKGITADTGSKFSSSGNVFLLLMSTYDPLTDPEHPEYSLDPICYHPSIDIKSNISKVLFYAPNGCLSVYAPSASEDFIGSAAGKRISFKQLQHGLVYDSYLGSSQFGPPTLSNWSTIYFKEE